MLAIGILMAVVICAPEVFAQEKKKPTRFEKVNRAKNKKNRGKDKREKAKSNKLQIRTNRFKTRSKQGDKPHKGDITGRRVTEKSTPKRTSSAGYAQPNPYAGRKRSSEASKAKSNRNVVRKAPKGGEKSYGGGYSGGGLGSRSVSGRRKKIYGASGAANRSIRKSETVTAKSINLNTPPHLSASRDPERPKRKRRIIPKSASGAFRVRKRQNPYAHPFRSKTKWERAYKGDITGKPFQRKQTPEKPVDKKLYRPKVRSVKRGEKPYRGPSMGGFRTATRPRERAWKDDISRTRLRRTTTPERSGGIGRPVLSISGKGKKRGDQPYRGRSLGGYKSKTKSAEFKRPSRALSGKPPSVNAQRGARFQGFLRARRPQNSGGKSISGKRWNNNNRPVTVQTSGNALKAARFQGNFKSRKPKAGGGSISAGLRNNRGKPIGAASPSRETARAFQFQGNVKARRPLKGGGSKSREGWNNKGKPLYNRANAPGNEAIHAQLYFKGRTKRQSDYRRKPGAVKGATKGLAPTKSVARAGKFQGNLRGGRPLKGGGSVSREGWNNRGKPLINRRNAPGNEAIHAQIYFKGRTKIRGNYRKKPGAVKGATKGLAPTKSADQARKFEGRFKDTRKHAKKPSAVEGSLKGVRPTMVAGDYKGSQKRSWRYKKKPGAVDGALKGIRPTMVAGDYEGSQKRSWRYKKKPYAHEDALKGRAPIAAASKGARFEGRFKLSGRYKNKPYAAKGSIKGLGPSSAMAKASKYQGNMKLRKGMDRNMHPSARFTTHWNRNNSVMEKSKTFKFKRWWARIFRKSDSKPGSEKDSPKRPRYDKAEQGLWYE